MLVEVAASSNLRRLGLSGRDGLGENSGMLFVFDHSDFYDFWMKDMKFPLDIIWIKNNKVADLEENVPPPLAGAPDASPPVYKPEAPADSVLEVKAGFAGKNQVKIGDEVKIFSAFLEKTRPNFASQNLGGFPSNGSLENFRPPGFEYFIETLRQTPAQGRNFKVDRVLSRNSAYQKFLVSYESADFKISGVMNVPLGDPSSGGWPVIILNHGLIHPSVYFPGRGSRREQDFFARRGYATIHPDYRGLGFSSPAPYPISEHDFYVGYTEDVTNLIDALKKLNSSLLDVQRIGMWGHSMGGGIAARVMVLRPEVRAFVLFAPLSAEVEDNFYELPKKETARLRKVYGSESAEAYKKMSPLTYFADISSPVQLNHGDADADVPIEFSEKMFAALKQYNKKAEFFTYPGEGHEFGEGWALAAERALQFFDRYVK